MNTTSEVILAKNILINFKKYNKEDIQWANDTILLFGDLEDMELILY